MCFMAAILLLNNPAKWKLVKKTDMGMKDATRTMGMNVQMMIWRKKLQGNGERAQWWRLAVCGATYE